MAKTTLPLMSESAHGTIGGVLTFSLRGSGQQVRYQKKQKNAPSADQLVARAVYADACLAWKALEFGVIQFGDHYFGDSEEFNNELAEGEGMSGFNIFVQDYILAH
jgi:hypothetical protein